MPSPGVTAISVSPDARDELGGFAAKLTGAVGRRVTLDQAVRLAVRLATREVNGMAEPSGVDELHEMFDQLADEG